MEEYSPIRISTLPTGREIPFGLHIFFKETYVCYKESHSIIEAELLTKLKKQRVAKFYILAQDEKTYQSFLDSVLADSMNDPNVAVDEKADLAGGAASNAVEKMQKDPGSKEAYTMTEKAAGALLNLIQNNPEALKLIFDKQVDDSDEKIVKHSLNVSALSTKIASKVDCTQAEVENMAIAALVQYVSVPKDESIKEAFFKNRNDITPDERIALNNIPRKSVELLDGKDYINQHVIEFIRYNEETLQGNGPHKIKKLSKLQEIMNLVNSYDRRVTLQGIAPKQAFKDLQIDELGNFDLSTINLLKKVLTEDGMI